MTTIEQHHKHQEDGSYVAASARVVVTGVPLNSPKRVLSEDERSEQGSQIACQKYQQQQHQQKQSVGFDLASSNSVSSDGRQKPPMIYQDQLVQIQSSNNNNRTTDLNSAPDQNPRIQMQQQGLLTSLEQIKFVNGE